ncbi:WRKY DNA-binding transcription factor 70-like [Nicotiana tomentosiformis]|uniref:WRKY DNA-binding transcription factor 70-like n=1 Tax=Nicotiana tomentosiformis TaxID=4098 RepID=UPI00051C1A35|nr:WRKY DNA-binding transcription factor 70-like [Nicotiana tomentosiformis]
MESENYTQSDLEKVTEKLNRGRELTRRLREMIKKPEADAGDVLTEDLVGKIMSSFCETLSILRSNECSEVSQIVKSTEDSSGSCKTSSLKDRRGRYKRRKTLETTIKETSTLVDDGHAWRKYGQKHILNAKYPRNYFRCTHKFDQGCEANKQVQRIQENPPLFRVTYYGHHTCKTFPKVSQMICDSPTDEDSSVLLNFNSTNNHHHFLDMMVGTVGFADLSFQF